MMIFDLQRNTTTTYRHSHPRVHTNKPNQHQPSMFMTVLSTLSRPCGKNYAESFISTADRIFFLSSPTSHATPEYCAAILRMQHDCLLALENVDRPIRGYMGLSGQRPEASRPVENSFDSRLNRSIQAEHSIFPSLGSCLAHFATIDPLAGWLAGKSDLQAVPP